MCEKTHRIIGIVGKQEKVQEHIHRIGIPIDAFVLSADEPLEHRTVIEYLEKWSKEIGTAQYGASTLIGMLEFGGLEEKRECNADELSDGEKQKLLLLKALMSCNHYFIIWRLFRQLDKKNIEKITEMLIEFSTFSDIILACDEDTGFEICDKVIYCE